MAAGYDEVTAPSAPSLDQAIRLTIPAKPEYISLARLALTGLSRVRELDPETLADLKLAITSAARTPASPSRSLPVSLSVRQAKQRLQHW